MISICYLDLLHKLAVLVRRYPEKTSYLIAIEKVVQSIIERNGDAGEISKNGITKWDAFLCDIFGEDFLNSERILGTILYYPQRVSLAIDEYELLIKLFSKVKLLQIDNYIQIIDYMDMIHEYPDVIKTYQFNRMFLWNGFIKPFIKKNPFFISKDEIKQIKYFCGFAWWKFWL